MPGLVGLVAHDGLAKEHLDQMAARSSLARSGATLDILSTDRAALACDLHARARQGTQLAVDDGVLVGLNGEVFSLADTEGATSETFVRGTPGEPARTLVRLYRQFGIEFVSRLRGYFSLIIWDGPANTLFLVSDRFGLRPFYYQCTNGSITFASEVKALVSAAEPDIDEQGICDFILFGIPLGTRTLVSGVRRIPPASILTFQNGELLSEKVYWELEYGDRPQMVSSVEGAAQALHATLLEVLEESTTPDGVLELPLSGGLDTRALAALAVSRGRSLRTYTLGSEGSDDLRLGSLVARELGLPNQAWTLEPQDLIDWTHEAVYLTDGMYNPMDAPILFIAKRLPGDAQIVLDGVSSFDGQYRLTDLALCRLFPSHYSAAKLALKMLVAPIVRADGSILPGVLHPNYEPFAREHGSNALEALCDSVPVANRANPFDSIDFLDLRNRLPRFNMMGAVLLRAHCEVQQPFFDPRVVDLVTRFKPILRTKEKLVLGRLMTMIAPELAAMVYERTGLPANSGVGRHLLGYGQTFLRRGLGRLVPRARERARVAIDFGAWVQRDATLQEFIRSVLFDPQTSQRGYFDPDAVQKLVTDVFSGQTAYLPLVGRMLSLALWRR